MDWILDLLPAVLTFAIGFVLKSPIYQKGKRLIDELSKALEDDKLSAEEVQRIRDIFK